MVVGDQVAQGSQGICHVFFFFFFFLCLRDSQLGDEVQEMAHFENSNPFPRLVAPCEDPRAHKLLWESRTLLKTWYNGKGPQMMS